MALGFGASALALAFIWAFVGNLRLATAQEANVGVEVPRPGKTTLVVAARDTSQSYAVYLPKNYDPTRPSPILYAFHPAARGDKLVELFREACERHGWIVAGSMNSRNGPPEPVFEALQAIWADTESRFNLSPNQRYATGFSGGSRVAFGFARMNRGRFAGVIAMGAGVSTDKVLPEKEIAVYVTCGETDFNREPELEFWLVPSLKENGNAHKFRTFPGGHIPPPKEVAGEAVDWLAGLQTPGSKSSD